MQTAVNPPLCAEEFDLGAMSYALAHEAKKSKTYLERCIRMGESNKYLILDNGADELGEGMRGDEYWELVEKIKPQEVIAPDVLQDAKETIERTKQFLNDLQKLREESNWIGPGTGYWLDELKVMAVAQGRDWDEWVNCYNEWLCDDRVDVIGVPYDIEFATSTFNTEGANRTEQRAINRLNVVEKLDRTNMLTKPIHLLGMNNLDELGLYIDIPMVRSNDTTAPFAAALAGRKWDLGESEEKTWPSLDFDVKSDDFIATEREIDYNLMAYFIVTRDFTGMQNLIESQMIRMASA